MSAARTPARALAALAASLLALGAFAPLSAGEGPAAERPAAELPAAERAPSPPRAHGARTISLNETGRLRLTSKHGFTLNEQGSATGTVVGTIYVHLTAVSNTRVTAEVNIYAHGASFSGNGNASYRRSSTLASFSGSMSINRGTGSYAHIHGSGLSFSGTIAESNRDAITVHVSGRVSA